MSFFEGVVAVLYVIVGAIITGVLMCLSMLAMVIGWITKR